MLTTALHQLSTLWIHFEAQRQTSSSRVIAQFRVVPLEVRGDHGNRLEVRNSAPSANGPVSSALISFRMSVSRFASLTVRLLRGKSGSEQNSGPVGVDPL
jgi:hypothetical protein